MPTITGDLRLVTDKAATISAVWIRSEKIRTDGAKVVLSHNDVVPVENGRFTVNVQPGPAVVIPVATATPDRPIKILVTDSTTTLAQAIDAAGTFTDDERDRIVQLAQTVTRAVSQAQAAATQAQQTLTQATATATSTRRGLIRLAGDLSGTADNPTVPGKLNTSEVATTATADKVVRRVAGGQISLPSATPATDQATSRSYVETLLASYAKAATLSNYVPKSDASTAATAGKIPIRYYGGQIQVPNTPTDPAHAASKSYVDAQRDTRAPVTHSHTKAQITGLTTDLANLTAAVDRKLNLTDVDHAVSPSKVVRRTSQSYIEVPLNPWHANHAMPKGYFDTIETSFDSGRIRARKSGNVIVITGDDVRDVSQVTLPTNMRPTHSTPFTYSTQYNSGRGYVTTVGKITGVTTGGSFNITYII